MIQNCVPWNFGKRVDLLWLYFHNCEFHYEYKYEMHFSTIKLYILGLNAFLAEGGNTEFPLLNDSNSRRGYLLTLIK